MMKLTFLGTSAANAFPEAFCSCKNCVEARVLGGPSLRKRSSAIIKDDLLIDLGPDIMVAAQIHNRPLTNVQFCLQTHGHADHLDTSHLLSRSPGFGVIGAPKLHFYASPATCTRMVQTFERDLSSDSLRDPETGERLNLELHSIEPWQTLTIGLYRVMAVPANHDPGVEPLLYVIEAEGRSIFYGTDTAVLPEETWRGLQCCKLRFDLVILDHTYGPKETGTDHLSAHQLIEHYARMREEGLLSDNAQVYATHIAHEGNPPHPRLSEFAAENGYEIAYDGLTV
jgi:phosphoribosyl 1,2-cyclic phosphate phosphodiesterase